MTQEEMVPLDRPWLSPEERPSWLRRLIVLAAIGTVLVVVGQRVHLPYVVIGPGPTRDAAKLTKIEARTYSSQGSFFVTTALVKDEDGIPLDVAVEAMLDPDEVLVRRELIYPEDSTRKETNQRNKADMSESQIEASVAAMSVLGLPVEPDGAFVQDVSRESMARKWIEPGDVIVMVDGQPVKAKEDLTPLVGKHPVGDKVKVTVLREGQRREVEFATSESPDTKGRPVLGVTVVQNYRLPFTIRIDAGDIGGPSAGLIFALAIYDLLEPSDLTKGRKIAGTGVIRPDGSVEQVGAVAQKVRGAIEAGASIFVVPEPESQEALRAAKGSSMRIVGVSTLREAIESLGSDD